MARNITPQSCIIWGRIENTNQKIGDLTPFDESTILEEEANVGDIKSWVEKNKKRGSDVVDRFAARFNPKKKTVVDGEGTPPNGKNLRNPEKKKTLG